MVDLVATCPKHFWQEWIDEGDAAGDPETGDLWAWRTRDPKAASIRPGDRFYVVACAKLRGYAPVIRVDRVPDGFEIIRGGGAVACTIDQPIPSFRGLRKRWWNRLEETPFRDWKTAGIK